VSGTRSIRWLDEPEEKDYLAVHSFLSMVLPPSSLSEVIAALHAAPHGRWAAKDILRVAGLPPLRPKESAEPTDHAGPRRYLVSPAIRLIVVAIMSAPKT
jgi:hypothetical protein